MALTLDLAGSLVPVTPNFREIFAITVHDVLGGNMKPKNRVG